MGIRNGKNNYKSSTGILVRLSPKVIEALGKKRKGFETPNDTLMRLLKIV